MHMQTCRIASTIQTDDPSGTLLPNCTQLTRLKIELMVCQATKDDIEQQMLKRRTAEAVSKPEAVKMGPMAAAGGLQGDGLAAGAEEQQAAELWQAVENPIRGPGRDTFHKVRWHSGTVSCLGALCLPLGSC